MQVRHSGSILRSIPACAGEPSEQVETIKPSEVYPRVCGGTLIQRIPKQVRYGLSPRVRGNPEQAPDPSSIVRSIPACAGEPMRGWLESTSNTVYPRVCGGTFGDPVWQFGKDGLSPRVRGNQSLTIIPFITSGSIPACAGEPLLVHVKAEAVRVYPRVCGGTSMIRLFVRLWKGLSPRVRGNPKLLWPL